jgi:ubiquinone biosynthesis protein UbiJ
MTGAIDPALHTAGLAAIETALNRALDMAPGSKAKLAAMEDSVFALNCTAPLVEVYLQPGPDGIRLMNFYDGEVTTRVSGAASDFTDLATATDPAAALINGRLELSGDSAPLIELQKILAGLDLDWEAPLVDSLGDVAGHQLAQLLRSAYGWGRQASTGIERQLDEFIHEEARLSPPRLELEDFYKDVQALELRVDRLQSRTRRLRKRLQQLQQERV